MTMAEPKAELTKIADRFMILATEQRDKDQGISYQAFHVSEICRQAAENLQQDPVEPELEGGGRSWWYACPECRSIVHYRNKFCAECGRKLNWKGFR